MTESPFKQLDNKTIAIVVALIGLVGTIIAAIIQNQGVRTQVELPIMYTQTAEVELTSISLLQQQGEEIIQQIRTPTPFQPLPQETHVVTFSPTLPINETSSINSTPTPIIYSKATSTPTMSPTPVGFYDGLNINVEIPAKDTAILFDGELIISVSHISTYDNEVTAYFSTPGYPEALVEKMGAGFKFPYETTRKFEILITGFGNGFTPSVKFNIAYLGDTGESSKIIRLCETLTIVEKNTGDFFGGALRITLDNSSSYDNSVTAFVNSTNHESVIVDEKFIGYRFYYPDGAKYEILISGFGTGFSESVEFIACQLHE